MNPHRLEYLWYPVYRHVLEGITATNECAQIEEQAWVIQPQVEPAADRTMTLSTADRYLIPDLRVTIQGETDYIVMFLEAKRSIPGSLSRFGIPTGRKGLQDLCVLLKEAVWQVEGQLLLYLESAPRGLPENQTFSLIATCGPWFLENTVRRSDLRLRGVRVNRYIPPATFPTILNQDLAKAINDSMVAVSFEKPFITLFPGWFKENPVLLESSQAEDKLRQMRSWLSIQNFPNA
jgi:hypothetical protein